MKKIVVFLGSLMLGALLAGCASEPVYNKFMDPNLPVRQNAALSVHTNIMIGMIDYSFSLGKYGGNAKGREPILILAPGSHTFGVSYFMGDNDNYTKTDAVIITHNFEAGRYYRLYPQKNGKQILFLIEDQTVEGIWDTKPLSSVQPTKQKENKSTSTLPTFPRPGSMTNDEYMKAIIEASKSSVPTQLEGRWKSITDERQSYIFMGNIYIQNANPEKTSDGFISGTFEISGNNLTITMYAVANMASSGKGIAYYDKPFTNKMKWSLPDTDTLILDKVTYKREKLSDNAE